MNISAFDEFPTERYNIF